MPVSPRIRGGCGRELDAAVSVRGEREPAAGDVVAGGCGGAAQRDVRVRCAREHDFDAASECGGV